MDAVNNAIRPLLNKKYVLAEYYEHALSETSKSQAIAYVSLNCDDKTIWGVGIKNDIIDASIAALNSALNKLNK